MSEDAIFCLQARLDVEACVVAFTACFDDGDLDGMLSRFASDGLWRRPDGDLHGRPALSTFMERRSQAIFVRHLLTNFRIEMLSAREARCVCYVTVLRAARDRAPPFALEGVNLMGQYHDRLTRVGDAWMIADRSVVIELRETGRAS